MIRRYLPLATTILVLILGYLFCASQFRNFASMRVIGNLLTDNAFLGIVAVGMTFAIISGGIDLSVGSVIAFTTVFLAAIIEYYHVHPFVAFPLAIVMCALFGAGMGAIVHYLRMPPFIVTLAGMFLARGLSFLITTSSIPITHPIYSDLNDVAFYIGTGRISLIAILMVLTFLFGIVLLHFTRFGANVYAIGGNATSAQLMGVPVAWTTIRIYMLSSTLAALAGVVFSLYTSAGYSLNCVGVELDAIASVVIGGTSLMGGYGRIGGTIIGSIIMGILINGLVLMNVSAYYQQIITGLIIVLAVAFDTYAKSRRGAL